MNSHTVGLVGGYSIEIEISRLNIRLELMRNKLVYMLCVKAIFFQTCFTLELQRSRPFHLDYYSFFKLNAVGIKYMRLHIDGEVNEELFFDST